MQRPGETDSKKHYDNSISLLPFVPSCLPQRQIHYQFLLHIFRKTIAWNSILKIFGTFSLAFSPAQLLTLMVPRMKSSGYRIEWWWIAVATGSIFLSLSSSWRKQTKAKDQRQVNHSNLILPSTEIVTSIITQRQWGTLMALI